jgi:membrane glycosyltransferase
MASIVPERDFLRRVVFHGLVLVTMGILTWLFADLLWRIDFSALKAVLVVTFSLLAYPIANGFWQSTIGFFASLRDREPLPEKPLLSPDTLQEPFVAVNIPVYNEDIEAVLARLRTLFLSLQETGQTAAFDFYILSDSTNPDNWILEEYGWARLCRQLGCFDRIFYRRRRRNVHQKAGNLLDFCESWGRRYKHMIVLDADSLMDGQALVRLTARMEANPRLGILQSVPLLTQARSRFAVLQQFANRVYGPLFSRGMAFWQGAKGNYWGHNAIIRVEPFIRHCALPDLPGRPPLGGKILSHDFVEAALMVKAGYEVRMDTDTEGSFEEGPVDLLDSATRDRRWCQGNLQHVWLLFAERLHGASKLHFINGIFAYAGSFFWMVFLAITIALSFEWEKSQLSLIPVEGSSPLGALSIGQHAAVLFSFVLSLLLLPKVWGWLAAVLKPARRRQLGGFRNLTILAILEVAVSSLLAPVLMVFHSRFVVLTLFGKGISWTAQSRDHEGLSWISAFRALRLHTAVGLLVLLVAFRVDLQFVLWLSPIWAGLMGSVPLAVWSSRRVQETSGKQFLAAVESSPIETNYADIRQHANLGLGFFAESGNGLQNAVVDPIINAIHLSLLEDSPGIERSSASLPGDDFFKSDPGRLGRDEVLALLESPDVIRALHQRIWRLTEQDLHPEWQRVIDRYTLKPVFVA